MNDLCTAFGGRHRGDCVGPFSRCRAGVLSWADTTCQSVLDSAPDTLLLINRAGEIIAANLQAEVLFRCSRERLIGSVVESLIPARFRERHQQYREQFFSDPRARPMGVRSELFALRGDDTEIPVDVSLSPLVTECGIFVICAVRDATERRQAEEHKAAVLILRRSEERFRLMADTAPVLVWESGTDKLWTYVNKPWLDFTGRSMEKELGNGWTECVHPEDLPRCLGTYASFDRREKFRMEYRLRRHDGAYRWILGIGVPRFNQDCSFAGYIGIGVDITERKLGEEALAGVGRRLIEAQDRERTRIARDLHDDVAQRLALLTIDLEGVQQNFALASDLRARLEEMRTQIAQIATDVQTLSHQLHSPKLEYLGLVRAIESFCKEFAEHQKVKIDFRSHDVPGRLHPDISLGLFRVLQQALHNAARHSGVKQFEVQLWAASGEIHLTVSDLGRGFDVQAAMQGRGLGLTSMLERLRILEGELAISSQPKRGATIHVRVPLSSSSDSVRAAV